MGVFFAPALSHPSFSEIFPGAPRGGGWFLRVWGPNTAKYRKAPHPVPVVLKNTVGFFLVTEVTVAPSSPAGDLPRPGCTSAQGPSKPGGGLQADVGTCP